MRRCARVLYGVSVCVMRLLTYGGEGVLAIASAVGGCGGVVGGWVVFSCQGVDLKVVHVSQTVDVFAFGLVCNIYCVCVSAQQISACNSNSFEGFLFKRVQVFYTCFIRRS